MPKPPCFKCEDRNETCHGSCKKYQAFRRMKDAENAAKFSAKGVDLYVREAAAKRKKKARREK